MSERQVHPESLISLHHMMVEQLRQFENACHSKITEQTLRLGFSKHRSTQVGHWLNRYHDTWNRLEAAGLRVDSINLPFLRNIPAPGSWPTGELVWWPHSNIRWNTDGFEEPRRNPRNMLPNGDID